MPSRFATSADRISHKNVLSAATQQPSRNVLRYLRLLWLCLLFVAIDMQRVAPAYALEHQQIAQKQIAQTNAAVIDPHLLLTTSTSTAVELQTHTVDMQFQYNESFSLAVDALYRLYNPADVQVTLPLQFAPDQLDGQTITFSQSRLSGVSLTVDGQSGEIQQTGDALYTTQVRIDPDERVELRIRYQLSMPNTLLPTVRYTTYALGKWSGVASMRLSLATPEQITTESRVRIEPSNWRYQVTDNPRLPDIKWLYDEITFPTRPFIFQFIDPAHWARIVEAGQAAQPNASVRNFYLLGELYQQLYTALPQTSGTVSAVDNTFIDEALRNDADATAALRARFYAQAVGAYSGGIESNRRNGSADSADMLALHLVLAQLYRERAVDDINKSTTYAQLMASEATEAMRYMANDDDRRAELSRWQFEGLYSIYTIERSNRNWPQALAILDQIDAVLASNPNGDFTNSQINPTRITDERRTITIYQALNLLEQGNRDSAFSLAGTQIADAELRPPITSQSLFSSWQITMTIHAKSERVDNAVVNGIDLNMIGITTPEHYQEAYSSLQELLARWWNADATRARPTIRDITQTRSVQTNVPTVYHVLIPLSSTEDARLLLQNMPEGDEWLLLRTLLGQIDPVVQNDLGLISQQLEIAQRLDLRAVGDQWNSIATSLEAQADNFETIGTTMGDADSLAAEASLRARIQEVNYRNAAEQWQSLTRDSWILSEIKLQSSHGDQRMSWLSTVVSPPQTRQLANSNLNTVRLYTVLFAALIVIFLLAALLWWLIGY